MKPSWTGCWVRPTHEDVLVPGDDGRGRERARVGRTHRFERTHGGARRAAFAPVPGVVVARLVHRPALPPSPARRAGRVLLPAGSAPACWRGSAAGPCRSLPHPPPP